MASLNLFLSPKDLEGVKPYGAASVPTETDFYKAKVTDICDLVAKDGSVTPGVAKVVIAFDDPAHAVGETNILIDTPDRAFTDSPGFTAAEKKKSAMAKWVALLQSAGYTPAHYANGAGRDWIVGRTIYVEWHASQVQGEFGEISGRLFLPQADYDLAKKSGTKPVVRARRATADPAAAAAGQGTYNPPPPPAGVAGPPAVPPAAPAAPPPAPGGTVPAPVGTGYAPPPPPAR